MGEPASAVDMLRALPPQAKLREKISRDRDFDALRDSKPLQDLMAELLRAETTRAPK
jgi:hypothetical protein